MVFPDVQSGYFHVCADVRVSVLEVSDDHSMSTGGSAVMYSTTSTVVVAAGLEFSYDFAQGVGEDQCLLWAHSCPLFGVFLTQQCYLAVEFLLE